MATTSTESKDSVKPAPLDLDPLVQAKRVNVPDEQQKLHDHNSEAHSENVGEGSSTTFPAAATEEIVPVRPPPCDQNPESMDNMDPQLYKAAMVGDMELLTSDYPHDLTRCLSPQKNTVLHIAIEFRHKNIVKKLIQLCPSLITQHNSKGDTPLHVAARAGHLDLTKLLTPALEEGNLVRLAGGVALRMRNLEGSNPIHEALKKSHEEVALHLLAFEEGHHELARQVNMAGESLLYLAAEAGLDEVVQKIIDGRHYSTEGPDGQNPLHIAVIKGRLGVVKILLDKERNLIPQADCFGNTVLHYASAKSYRRICMDKDKDNDRYTEHLWSWTREHKQKKILRRLLEANSSLAYVPNRNGDYPLFIAIRKDFDWAADTILDHCPDSAELVNQNGQNALHLAVMEKNYYISRRLTERLEVKKLINELDNDGNTPMHLATLTDQHDIMRLLIAEEPADLTMSNNEGLTAMDICGYTKREHLIRDTLREFGAVPGRKRWQEQFPTPPRPRPPPAWRPPSKPKPKPKPDPPPPPEYDIEENAPPPPQPPLQPQPQPQSEPQPQPQPESEPQPQPKSEFKEISPEFRKICLQTLPIVTSLVATVTFAAAITVPGGYKNDGPREGLPVFMRSSALQVFVLSDILAFCSSMAATVLLVYGNAHSEDAFKVYSALKTCYYISGVAILATIIAFMTAVFVLTSKESLWLAVTSLVLGFAVPLFLLLYRLGLETIKQALAL